MENCLFCKIIKGEIPSTKIMETDKFIAFLDIAPITQGHTLVVPKQHCSDLLAFPQGDAEGWMIFLQEVASQVKESMGADGLNIGTNNGAAAGQVVFHQHTHIIPRWDNDGLESWPSKQASPEELKKIQEKITQNL